MTHSSTPSPQGTAAAAAVRTGDERARALIAALERKDIAELERTVHPQATLTIPLSFSGAPEPAAHFAGKDEVMGYLRGVASSMDRIAFRSVRISVTAEGDTAFVQADGDFTAADGRPYNNVYILRVDWEEGLVAHIDEYANPVAFIGAFGEVSA